MIVYRLDRIDKEGKELQVALGRLTGRKQVNPRIGSQSPVVVFSRTVEPLKRLFMEQDLEIVLLAHPLHRLHQHHVMIDGYIGLLVDRSYLELIECHLIVPRFHRNTQLHALLFQVAQVLQHPGRDCAEIVVLHLLPFGRFLSEKRTPGQYQIGTRMVQRGIDQKIFLLSSQS